MNRPASVITTLMLFSILLLSSILSLVENFSDGIGYFLGATSFPLLVLIGLVGVLMKKRWARFYSSILIVFFALLTIALPLIGASEQPVQKEHFFVIAIMTALLGWWAFSLGLGKASKDYFNS